MTPNQSPSAEISDTELQEAKDKLSKMSPNELLGIWIALTEAESENTRLQAENKKQKGMFRQSLRKGLGLTKAILLEDNRFLRRQNARLLDELSWIQDIANSESYGEGGSTPLERLKDIKQHCDDILSPSV